HADRHRLALPRPQRPLPGPGPTAGPVAELPRVRHPAHGPAPAPRGLRAPDRGGGLAAPAAPRALTAPQGLPGGGVRLPRQAGRCARGGVMSGQPAGTGPGDRQGTGPADFGMRDGETPRGWLARLRAVVPDGLPPELQSDLTAALCLAALRC